MLTPTQTPWCSIRAQHVVELRTSTDDPRCAVLALLAYNGRCGFETELLIDQAMTLRDALSAFITSCQNGPDPREASSMTDEPRSDDQAAQEADTATAHAHQEELLGDAYAAYIRLRPEGRARFRYWIDFADSPDEPF